MNKNLALLILPIAFGIAACGTTSTTPTAAPVVAPVAAVVVAPVTTAAPATTVAPVVTTSPPVVTTPSAEDQYVSDVQANTTTVTGGSATILRVGHAVCKALDAGNSFASVTDTMLVHSGDINGNDLGELLGRAVRDLCPSHLGDMTDYLATQ